MLNFIRNYFNKVSLVAITVGAGIGIASANAETLPSRKFPDEVKYSAPLDYSNFAKSKKFDSQLGVKFEIVDSLANAYSCYLPSINRSYSYSSEFNSLIFIKRGYEELSTSGDNNKNNLFVIKSSDWGKTWGAPWLVYNATDEAKGAARYPNASCFTFEKEFAVAFSAPLVDVNLTTDAWLGMATGFRGVTGSAYTSLDPSLYLNGETYKYSTDSRIIAITDKSGKDVITILEVATISPADNTNLQVASNILFRKNIDITTDEIKDVPPQWASSNFKTPANVNERSNDIIDFVQEKDSILYCAILGTAATEKKSHPGFSKSTDLGTSWSDFIYIPEQFSIDFAVAHNWDPEKCMYSWGSKGFAILENGDCSFILRVMLLDENNYIKDSYIVETVYSQTNKTWVWNTLFQLSSKTYTYSDVKNSAGEAVNVGDNEIQLAKTEDGKTLVAKWIDILVLDSAASTWTTDIFVASRSMNSSVWSAPTNLTQSEEMDRFTQLPDVVPNDITKLPIMKLVSKTASGISDDEYRIAQFKAQEPQYLMKMVYAPAGVNDDPTTEPCDCTKLDLQKITPNPSNTDNMVTVSFFMPKKSVIDINLYDYTGKLISDLREFDKEYDEKSNSIQINLQTINNGAIPVGSYYISIETLGQKVTKLLTVVK